MGIVICVTNLFGPFGGCGCHLHRLCGSVRLSVEFGGLKFCSILKPASIEV